MKWSTQDVAPFKRRSVSKKGVNHKRNAQKTWLKSQTLLLKMLVVQNSSVVGLLLCPNILNSTQLPDIPRDKCLYTMKHGPKNTIAKKVKIPKCVSVLFYFLDK